MARLYVLVFIMLCGSVPFYFTGQVVRVIDGDTIEVQLDDKVIPVRLYGVETPENNQAFSNAARQFTDSIATGQWVTVTVGMVNLPDGKILNLELIKNGLAWWSRKYAPGDSTLAQLEQEARLARKGLWSQRKPVAPWTYREQISKKLEPLTE